MKRAPLHRWDISPREAIALQRRLRDRLITAPIRGRVKLVAGGDIAYCRRDEMLFAAMVLIRLPEMETVEEAVVTRRAEYPYVPGLLSFREAPALLEAFAELKQRPDALLVDGQGQAHPRGVGIAAHLGLWLDLPTIGCAKSRLCGEHEEPGSEPGDHAPLFLDGRVIGAVLRTRKGVKPLYVSAGHRSNLRDALRVVLRCCAGYRLPEPTRRSHILVTRLRAEYERASHGKNKGYENGRAGHSAERAYSVAGSWRKYDLRRS